MRTIVSGCLLLACSLCIAVSVAAQQNGTIVIQATPADALVRIMNISPPYEAGMSLEPGVYDIEVSKEGFIAERRDVTVQGGQENRFTFALKEAPPEGSLVVATEPADAQVRIMNIAPPYEEGMSLKQGEYELEISKPGYETIADTVTLQAGQENRYTYTLQSAAPEPVTEPAAATAESESTTQPQASEEVAEQAAEQPSQVEAQIPTAPESGAEAVQTPGDNATTGTLTVNTEPQNATVRIMNIKPPYEAGMALEPGLYALQVSHPGYATQSLDYMVEAGTENTVTVTLSLDGTPEAATTLAPQSPAKASPAMQSELTEDFDNNERNWYETTSAQVEIVVQDGHYHIAHKDDAQGWIAWNKAPFDPKSDFAVEATFAKVDGVLDYGYGLLWGVTRNGESYHSFRISGNGLYSYRQENAGQVATIIDWTPSSAIVPGLGAINTIHVRRQGDTLEFYVNGELVDSASYIPAEGTMVGFKVDNRQTVDVDTLRVGTTQ